MTADSSVDTEYRTNNLSLVAVLAIEGFERARTEWNRDANSVFWIYEMDEELAEQIDKFMVGDARVEPNAFSRFYAQFKEEMFETRRRAQNHG